MCASQSVPVIGDFTIFPRDCSHIWPSYNRKYDCVFFPNASNISDCKSVAFFFSQNPEVLSSSPCRPFQESFVVFTKFVGLFLTEQTSMLLWEVANSCRPPHALCGSSLYTLVHRVATQNKMYIRFAVQCVSTDRR